MTDKEPTEDSVMALAAAFDAGKDIDTPTTPEVPAEKQAAEPVDKSVEQEVKAKADDEDKGDKSADSKDSEAKETEKTEAEKEKSQSAKNRERKEKTWQEINAEKEALRAEKAAIAREKEQLQKSRLTATESLRDEHGATAKDYRDAAKSLRDKGEAAMADAAEKLASNLDAKEQQLKQQRAMEELQTSWAKTYSELSDKHPALKDQSSELYQATVAVLNEYKLLTQNPDGLRYAVRAAEINLQAKEFEGTKAEFAKLKTEYEKLQKKLTIAGGSPTSAPQEAKTFDKMTLKEQEAFLEKAAMEHDRASGFA